MKMWYVWYQSGDKMKSVIIRAKDSRSAVRRARVRAVDCWEAPADIQIRGKNG